MVESVKSASDVICPIAGGVTTVNKQLADSPELINESPYEEGWILRIKGDAELVILGKMRLDEYNKWLANSDK